MKILPPRSNRHWQKNWGWVLLAALLSYGLPANSRAQTLSEKQLLLPLLRLLAYDRRIDDSISTNDIEIAVFYKVGDNDSEACADKTVASLTEIAQIMQIGKRNLKTRKIHFTSAFKNRDYPDNTKMALVCSGLEAELSAIKNTTRIDPKNKSNHKPVISATTQAKYLRSGLAFYATDNAGQVKLTVDKHAVEREGIQLAGNVYGSKSIEFIDSSQ